ncbi:flagellar export chaperone FliS [Acetonema longum]|uniref:Flagellar secretion chaperone FliS n=1 Tax=Acetonema longum DSM 6540 TaxID=1009370 RepID=F7NNW6_9FIRM|nr:flagellar export chaperone FliS [Acetonema longum]EGO62300.1 flagellar protein FliS [Acetonema longum DSM 6540]
MNLASTANAYKNQQIMTASPEELTLMLYNGALKFMTESVQAIEEKKYEKAHETNIRSQNIIREFMTTLDMQYELSHNLYEIYDYMHRSLIEANLKKDAAKLKEIRDLLRELRDAWAEAMKRARQDRVGAAVGK